MARDSGLRCAPSYEATQTSSSVSFDERLLQHGNDQWTVREVDAHQTPGAPSQSCLICESSDVIRRLWRYPQNWRSLSDDELWRLVDSGGK